MKELQLTTNYSGTDISDACKNPENYRYLYLNFSTENNSLPGVSQKNQSQLPISVVDHRVTVKKYELILEKGRIAVILGYRLRNCHVNFRNYCRA